MQSRNEQLQLAESVFRNVIEHLKRRIKRIQDEGEDRVGLVGEEQTPPDQSTVTALRLEICLYSLCLDWVRTQLPEQHGPGEEERRHLRENFFRLMTTVARSELLRDANTRSFGLAGGAAQTRPLTNAEMFTALEGTAERQLANLIAM